MKKCVLLTYVTLGLCMALPFATSVDSRSFVIYNDAHKKCVKVVNPNVVQAGPCDPSSEAQQFRWTSSSRILSISHKLCLAAQDLKDWMQVLVLPCNEESPMQIWECKNETLFGLKGHTLHLNYGNQHEPNMLMYKGTGTWSRWQIYGTNQDLCSRGYQELITIGGNSFGKPCQFPFKFSEKWYAECTLEGRSDGHLWCSTETDYNTERKWGFCPTTSPSGWDSDPVTGVLYQRNTQSALTWHQARKSCQQQGADLLSIVELHEQTYISGLTNTLGSSLWIGLNSLDFESGWQWSNGNPFRYLNWAPGNPSLEPGLNCAAMNAGKASKWESLACNKKLGYICRKGNSTAITPIIAKDQPSFCPASWVPYAGHCYSLKRTKTMWKDALAACHKEGADLVSIHNIEEHSFLITQSGYTLNDEVWIGLSDQKTQNLFEWSDRSHVTFAKWLVGEPSHATNLREDCVLMKGKDGKWSDHMCEKEHGYICKKKASSKHEGSAEVLIPGCPSGWVRFNSYCYSIAVVAKTFNEAQAECGQKTAALVNVADRYENAFLISQIGLRPEKYFWIGLSNTEHADTFKWTNGQKVKFTHFNVGKPDKQQGCVAMETGLSAGLWDVLPCDSKQKFICKKLAEGITTTKEPPITQAPRCFTGWIPRDSTTCYRIFFKKDDEKKTWLEARDYCRALGGDLLSLHSENEASNLPYDWNNTPAWIGLNNLDSNTGFVWTDNSPVNFENWKYGEPNNYNNNELCVELGFSYGHKWNDRDCEFYNNWLCQIPIGVVPKPEPTGSTQAQYNITDDGWIQFNDSQYYINTQRMSMEDARAFCKKNHSDLVVITGQSERRFLWKQIVRGSESQYYIGMMVGLDKSFSWVDGSPVTYTAWEQNEPNFANNDENCVTIYKSMGFWNDINCGVELPSVCKRGVNYVPATIGPTVEPKGGCAPEWIPFNGKCYKIVEKDNEKSWQDARQYCISQGGNLVSIQSVSEQAFLTTAMQGVSDDLWIGLNDVNWEMRFLWTDGKGVRYTNWAKGHPVSIPEGRRTYGNDVLGRYDYGPIALHPWLESDEHSEFDCVVTVKEPSWITGMWKVEDCSEMRGFICKRNLDSQIQPPITTLSPQAFIKFGNDSYKVQKDKMSWDEARRQCKADDADLASVLDSLAYSFTMLRISKLQEPVWIGLNRNQSSGNYHWVDNWMLQYTRWAAEEPKKNFGCVYVDTDGKWKTADCTNTYYSLCKRSPLIAPTEPPQLPGNCPESKRRRTWIPFRGHCYSFVASQNENWAHATVECMRMGASLLSVDDAQEYQFIRKNIEMLHDEAKSFWIGMHRAHTGEWMWIDSMSVAYTNWAQRLPSTYGDCVHVRSESGYWFNSQCNSLKPFICKTEKVVPPTERKPVVAHMNDVPHSYTGIVVALVLIIIAVAGLAAFLFFKRSHIPVIGECTFDNTLYFNAPGRSSATVDTKGLVANIEQNEQA